MISLILNISQSVRELEVIRNEKCSDQLLLVGLTLLITESSDNSKDLFPWGDIPMVQDHHLHEQTNLSCILYIYAVSYLNLARTLTVIVVSPLGKSQAVMIQQYRTNIQKQIFNIYFSLFCILMITSCLPKDVYVSFSV